ncbi:MAG: CYTH domain-containing protein, partial [Acidimicrobiia bacterium]|nr:CYTH domain-containing protein [Acidimicrobiia bacterium]
MSSIEREIKFAPPAGFRLPPLTDPGSYVFASPETTTTLTATYYDTADLRITRSGSSLRYRDPEGWTVKLPRPDDNGDDDEVLARDEHHVTGDPGSPPDAALELVRSRTRGASVAAVATLRSTRTTVLLRDAQGAGLGEVVNDAAEVTFPDPSPDQDRDQVAARVRFG